MGRKRGIRGPLLTAMLGIMMITTGCSKDQTEAERIQVDVNFEISSAPSKAALPEEGTISNINLMIFDAFGRLTEHIYSDPWNGSTKVSLIKGETYRFVALANFGYRVMAKTLEEAERLEFHLTYPDEYREGLPMAAVQESFTITDSSQLRIRLQSLMAKISLKIDRSNLSEDTQMYVTGVRIGNCPKKIQLFQDSKAEGPDDCFNVGFAHYGQECHPLNRYGNHGMSSEISMYMLENMQGETAEDGDPRLTNCSFIEIDIDYISSLWQSSSAPLTYRFYISEVPGNMNIERNSHYHITIIPENDGLHKEGWRVDKRGLKYIGPTGLEQYPAKYISGKIGEKIHIGCHVTPSHASFDVGEEYMKDDKAEGIYDYLIDPDGYGATLTLTGPGRGLIYMEAGDPVNDAALFIIEVDTGQ